MAAKYAMSELTKNTVQHLGALTNYLQEVKTE